MRGPASSTSWRECRVSSCGINGEVGIARRLRLRVQAMSQFMRGRRPRLKIYRCLMETQISMKKELPALEAFFAPIAGVLKDFADDHSLMLDRYYHQSPSW